MCNPRGDFKACFGFCEEVSAKSPTERYSASDNEGDETDLPTRRKSLFQEVNGTWDQKQFEKEGKKYWESVIVAGLKLHMRKLLALLIASVDETLRQVIYAGKSTTSPQNLDYFEFVAGVPKIKDGYNPAT